MRIYGNRSRVKRKSGTDRRSQRCFLLRATRRCSPERGLRAIGERRACLARAEGGGVPGRVWCERRRRRAEACARANGSRDKFRGSVLARRPRDRSGPAPRAQARPAEPADLDTNGDRLDRSGYRASCRVGRVSLGPSRVDGTSGPVDVGLQPTLPRRSANDTLDAAARAGPVGRRDSADRGRRDSRRTKRPPQTSRASLGLCGPAAGETLTGAGSTSRSWKCAARRTGCPQRQRPAPGQRRRDNLIKGYIAVLNRGNHSPTARTGPAESGHGSRSLLPRAALKPRPHPKPRVPPSAGPPRPLAHFAREPGAP